MEALERQLETRRPRQTPTRRQPWHEGKQEGEGAPGAYGIKKAGVERGLSGRMATNETDTAASLHHIPTTILQSHKA